MREKKTIKKDQDEISFLISVSGLIRIKLDLRNYKTYTVLYRV